MCHAEREFLQFSQRWFNSISVPMSLDHQGAQSLVGVLVDSTTLAQLDLDFNDIGAAGAERLRASCRGQASGLVL